MPNSSPSPVPFIHSCIPFVNGLSQKANDWDTRWDSSTESQSVAAESLERGYIAPRPGPPRLCQSTIMENERGNEMQNGKGGTSFQEKK